MNLNLFSVFAYTVLTYLTNWSYWYCFLLILSTQ